MLSRTEIVYPGSVLTFDLTSDREEQVLDRALKNGQSVLLLALKDPSIENPSFEDYLPMGTMVFIRQHFQLLGGNSKVIVEGICRAELSRIVRTSPYVEGEVVEYHYSPEELEENEERKVLTRLVSNSAIRFFKSSTGLPDFLLLPRLQKEDPGLLADEVAGHLDLNYKEAVEVLEELDVDKRLIIVHHALDLLSKLGNLEQEITEKAMDRMKKTQKDYLLQEQLQIIREELGEDDGDPLSISEEYRDKIMKLEISNDSKLALLKEVDRLSYISPMSPELNVIRSYLDLVLEMPWGKYTKDIHNLVMSRKILDRDHYGLNDVKERILEFLAVRQLNGNPKGTILCLVGPPGVGKTSIVRSIAEALGREFTSMRLGGVSDEAEIRGHRRTYVGAMPGRVISKIKQAETMNPVFLFDEVDKIGSDFRGDPSSALLELLDPEQNSDFVDRYLEIPFDLSQVFFITTANTTSTIPQPLLDRMEVIRIAGYTDDEKYKIASAYLVNKKRTEAGLTAKQLSISPAVLRDTIKFYTRESGVRELERQIAKICRKAARQIVEGKEKVKLNKKNLSDYLGSEKYPEEDRSQKPEIGMVNGLAWTEVGGEILLIESNKMEGGGGLLLTGSMGEVMKESAELAISYIRANADRFGISPAFYNLYDIHIHMPEGAVPKDGPSAGVSILSSLVSILTGRPVRNDLAMTGEITLTGKVLPVGGIKEKVLAAKRYGINTVYLPKANLVDLEEIEKKSIEGMKFIGLENVDKLIESVLMEPQEEKKKIVFQSDEMRNRIGFSPEKDLL